MPQLFQPAVLIVICVDSITDAPEFLLYIVGNDIKKLTLGDAPVESTLVSGKQFDGSPLFLDFNYKENRLYWATSKSIYRSFLSDTSSK